MFGSSQYSKDQILVLVPKYLVSWNHSYHKCALEFLLHEWIMNPMRPSIVQALSSGLIFTSGNIKCPFLAKVCSSSKYRRINLKKSQNIHSFSVSRNLRTFVTNNIKISAKFLCSCTKWSKTSSALYRNASWTQFLYKACLWLAFVQELRSRSTFVQASLVWSFCTLHRIFVLSRETACDKPTKLHKTSTI